MKLVLKHSEAVFHEEHGHTIQLVFEDLDAKRVYPSVVPISQLSRLLINCVCLNDLMQEKLRSQINKTFVPGDMPNYIHVKEKSE